MNIPGSTGRFSGPRGFTLIEVILSIAILTLGIVSVQRVFIGSLSALSVIENWSQAERLLEGKIWETGREVREKGIKFRKRKDSGLLLGSDRVFQYDISIREMDPDARLMEANASVSWGSAGSGHSIKRTFYMMVPYADWKS
jgi:prepilin-type N-terminal cleavage/methylation domain-containing protein